MWPVRRVWINKLGTQLCENDKKVKETYLIDCLDKEKKKRCLKRKGNFKFVN